MLVPLLLALISFLQIAPATAQITPAVAQAVTAPAGAPTDALVLLQEVTQRYANAKSYHIEATVESSSHNELSRSWDKSFVKAIVAGG